MEFTKEELNILLQLVNNSNFQGAILEIALELKKKIQGQLQEIKETKKEISKKA